jgi:hypothetical protein
VARITTGAPEGWIAVAPPTPRPGLDRCLARAERRLLANLDGEVTIVTGPSKRLAPEPGDEAHRPPHAGPLTDLQWDCESVRARLPLTHAGSVMIRDRIGCSGGSE